ncbi:hypothetical protein ACFLZ5_06300 [Thermodesulfobacteriota bacterium]
MRNVIFFTFMSFLFLNFSPGNFFIGNPDIAYAQDEWKQEYSAICAKTQNAMILTVDELQSLIDRCDKLQTQIDVLAGPQAKTEKKVYTKRLKMCRDLYDFALQHKEEKQ